MESRPQSLEKCHGVIQHPLSEKKKKNLSKWIRLLYLRKKLLNKATIANV